MRNDNNSNSFLDFLATWFFLDYFFNRDDSQVNGNTKPDYTGVWLSIATIVIGFIIQPFLTLPQQQILWLVVGILVLVLSPIFFLVLLVGMVIFAFIGYSMGL